MSEAGNKKISKNLQWVRGLPMLNAPWFPKKNLEETFDYVPHDGDIVIASYPKTGTTWLQYIVQQIITRGKSFPSFQEMIYTVIPFLEMAGAEVVDSMQYPRIYKHHFPYNMVPKNDKAKYLYTYRNPDDTFVSYYHFMQGLLDDPLDFDEFFEDFLSGNIGYGRYFEHVLSYLPHEDSKSVLLVSYEKLQADREGEILRIAKFLGEVHYQDISRDKSILSAIMKNTSFEYMKKNLSLDHPVPAQPGQPQRQKVNFFRKGVVGDGKKCLSADQQKRLRNLVSEVMKGTRVITEWLNNDK